MFILVIKLAHVSHQVGDVAVFYVRLQVILLL
jgi:hypothetical protein